MSDDDARPTFGSLFAGIGGIDLGLERAGWRCRWQVEWDPFCQRVLAHHWPDVARVGDIRDAHGADFCPVVADTRHPDASGRGHHPEGAEGTPRPIAPPRHCSGCLDPVDLIAGGFPCQPVSVAGKRGAQSDERWLWPEFARCICELRPRYVLVENVRNLLAVNDGSAFGEVLGDLAALGYDTRWDCIPAAAVGAPHLRDRVWIVASRAEQRRPLADAGRPGLQVAGYAEYGGGQAGTRQAVESAWRDYPAPSDTIGQRLEGFEQGRPAAGPVDGPGDGRDPGWWAVEPDVGRVAHGVSARVDRLRSLGNAVVPQVVEVIGLRLRGPVGL